MLIDRNSKTPIYIQIYDDINDRIRKGEYALGSMLPSENKLSAIYNVERATVRRALTMIAEDGRINRVPGLGTTVVDPEQTIKLDKQQNLVFLLQRSLQNTDRLSEPFNSKLMHTLDIECTKRGYTLLYKSFAETDSVDDIIQSCNPQGVFYTGYLSAESYKKFIHRGIPVVLLNVTHPFYPSIGLDNRGGAKMVVEYLYELGHRKIGFISGFPNGQHSRSRFMGYMEALESNGIAYDDNLVVEGDWLIESGKNAMNKFVENGNMPTAIFAANDVMAMGALTQAINLGMSVPDDISIVGFDNVDHSEYFRPALTTVAIDYETMSRAACMLMLDMIIHNNYELNVNVYIPLSLVERESALSL